VSVLYDVAIGGVSDHQGERQGGVTWLAWGQDNGWFSPGGDPVLPLAQAQARADAVRLAADDGKQRRLYRVFYRANDPAGSAFIQLDSGGGGFAHRLGLLCMGASLLLWLPFSRRRRS